MKFILASLKTLTYSKNSAVSRIKFLFCLSFAFIGRFCPVNIHSGLSEQYLGSQAGYGQTFQDSESQNKLSQASYWKAFHNY
jgi:hypothetical protein